MKAIPVYVELPIDLMPMPRSKYSTQLPGPVRDLSHVPEYISRNKVNVKRSRHVHTDNSPHKMRSTTNRYGTAR